MAAKKINLVDPVIVVPGITATYLLDEYPVSPEQVWNLLTKKFERVALHPDNLNYEATEPARIKPGQVFEVAYEELIEELRHNLRETEDSPIPVYPFGYDWRMPLEKIENEFDAFVNEVIERTLLLRHYYNSSYSKNPKVNLIGHSMGGLVITGYLINKGKKAPVNKVVTLASPFRGSFEAVMKIATGNAELGTASASSREREMARLTPALYYLIPSFRNGINFGKDIPESLFDTGAWQSTVIQSIAEFIRLKGVAPGKKENIEKKAKGLFEKLLSNAYEHARKINEFTLESAGLDERRWLAIVGVNTKTRVKLNIIKRNGNIELDLKSGDREDKWKEKNRNDRRMTGDGTVPYEGAMPPFLKEDNLVCVTPDDYGYWEVKDRALSMIGGFHGILPNMNMIHRLIVRFLKDLEDTRGNTWGSRAPGADKWDPPLKLTEWKTARKT
jgi:pimeloyl-ACP methyl ester carboxylesterase